MTMKIKKRINKKSIKKPARKPRKKHPVFDVKLDAEERELLRSVERGEWTPVADQEEAKAFAKRAAENYFCKKDARITLRISEGDLLKLKQKAAHKGLPYQTFIASVLHEYAEGHFIEKAA